MVVSDLNVLISGDGTRKELVVKRFMAAVMVAVNPLVDLNCAALPESVAEKRVVRHVKVAFSCAISNRSGKFEMADNGTLFLDEIGELSLALQAKLLRVLQYGDIQRVGDDRSLRSTCACWRRLTATYAKRCWQGDFALTCFIA